MELLNVENLCQIYGKGENEVRAVDVVSFSVSKGQMVAIIGASGSGKSTLLHMIGAVDRPTSGKIWLDGQAVPTLNPLYLQTGQGEYCSLPCLFWLFQISLEISCPLLNTQIFCHCQTEK